MLKFTRPFSKTKEERIKENPLNEWEVDFGAESITKSVLEDLNKVIDSAEDERDIQRFLREHPQILAQFVGGGHGRWVIPQKRFGSEFVADFVVGEKHSFGYEWVLVELESPRERMFTKAKQPAEKLRTAMGQVQQWRAFIQANASLVSNRIEKHGMGLEDIHNMSAGLVFIGRRGSGNDNRELRQQILTQNNIRIHSYDTLIDRARTPGLTTGEEISGKELSD